MKPEQDQQSPEHKRMDGSYSRRLVDEAEAPVENTTHSFILKLWLAQGVPDDRRTVWHGHITHVADGQRRYLKSPGDILAFVTSFLQPAGVKHNLMWRVRHWLCGRTDLH